MWDYDSMLGKAQVYFERAAKHPSVDDDELALWMVLGLEFLLRAPLAKVHPSMLAALDGDAILHANGIPISKDPKSVPTHTVLARLRQVVSGFDPDREKDATFLINMRNAELHTGDAALANVPTSAWLPRFLRVADVLCEHLGIEVADLITEEIETQGQALVDEQDAKTKHVVDEKIKNGKHIMVNLKPAEIQQRTPSALNLFPWTDDEEQVNCPACSTKISLTVEQVRSGSEQIDGDSVTRETIWIATDLSCPVCGLHLEDTAEIAAAGIEQQYIRTTSEDLEDRYAQVDDYIDYDYGND
ncbi:hypothetical protein [Mumia sp. DW29H23]|uniref:hypothetical protein n=1 Tax=Mumia sp. DW29H23 TaxID=3421241 RepID=UPI003D69F4C5